MSSSGLDRLLPLLGAGLVVGLGAAVSVWLRAAGRRRKASREALEHERRRARAARWWHQHTSTTVPHSRFFDSLIDDTGSHRAATTRPPSGR